jgi:hypothetical protein
LWPSNDATDSARESLATAPQVAPGVQPAQFLQAVVVSFAWQIVQSVAQEMDVAPLPRRLGQDLFDRLAQAGVVIGDRQLRPG